MCVGLTVCSHPVPWPPTRAPAARHLHTSNRPLKKTLSLWTVFKWQSYPIYQSQSVNNLSIRTSALIRPVLMIEISLSLSSCSSSHAVITVIIAAACAVFAASLPLSFSSLAYPRFHGAARSKNERRRRQGTRKHILKKILWFA